MDNLQDAVKDFLNHCQFEKGLSTKTLKAYKIDLAQLLSFLVSKGHNVELNSITKTELRDFLESISKFKPKTVKRKIATVKSLFNYLDFDDKVILNPFRKMKIKIKEAQVIPKVMNINEVEKILKAAYVKLESIRNKNSYAYIEAVRNI